MATFIRYQGNRTQNQFTEPCMNCFASVTYNVEEPIPSSKASGRKSIICPNCGEEMVVNFCDIALC